MQKTILRKPLKAFITLFLLLTAIATTTAFASDYFRKDKDIAGKIIDFDTRKPIPGVVVSAMWVTSVFRLTIEPTEKYYDYFETKTDENGEFKIPGKGRNIIRDMPPPKIKIFKAGYFAAHLHDLNPRSYPDIPFAIGIKKIDGQYVIPFVKRSVEKRKKSLTEYRQIPFSRMAFPGMAAAGVLPEKYRLYTEELEKEYKALGKTPYWQQNPLILRVKEGGVYPATEKAIEPKK
jgi:hypothetical protein